MFDIYPYKSQYLKNEMVDLIIQSDYEAGQIILLKLYHMEQLLEEREVTLSGNLHKESLSSFESVFSGYGVDIYAKDHQYLGSTSFDVVDYPGRSLRYGFVSDFAKEDGEAHTDIENLRKFHINLLQFYDWSYRHDCLVSSENDYEDMMGKKICKSTVIAKIDTAKKYGMKPMAYGAVYAASREYADAHPKEIYYNSCQEPFRFIDVFTIMNIGKDSVWHSHIVKQYCKAISEMGFSGIHMDTYGFPKTAYSHVSDTPKLIALQDEFKPLIEDTKLALNEIEKDNYLVFNNVGNWPLHTVANASVQALYIEVWNPYERYHHIKEIIQNAKKENPHNPVILAAYLAPFRLEQSDKAGNAALLLMASIVANGAYHLLLGEENAVLTQGYYSDYSLLTPSQASIMRKYYDFMIRYMNIFYDYTLKDVSMTHIGWDNYEYQCDFSNFSTYAEADKIWLTIRENTSLKTIQLINLCGCQNDYWNKGKELPILQKNLTFTVQVDCTVSALFSASPDEDGIARFIAFSSIKTEKGNFIRFTIEQLELWKLIVIKY